MTTPASTLRTAADLLKRHRPSDPRIPRFHLAADAVTHGVTTPLVQAAVDEARGIVEGEQ